MPDDILIGIDLGTTMLKAAAFNRRTGALLAAESAKLRVRSAPDGTREQDPPAVRRALRKAAGRLRATLDGEWKRVAGIGLAAQGGSAILADRQTGRAHTPMQLWNDTRPLSRLAEIGARRPVEYWRKLTYLEAPGAGLARIAWLRERRPELFDDARTLYVGAGEYLYFQLTGAWRQDAGNALQVGCYDARRQRLDVGPLELVGVGADFVAPMRERHETHPLSAAGAKLTGLAEGLPVAGPYMDHEAGYLSAVGSSDAPLQCSLGTAWVGNYVLPAGDPPESGFNLVLPSPVDDGRLIVRVMMAGNVTWDWALRTCVGSAGRRSLEKAEAIFRDELLPPDGLVSLPWLTHPNWFAPDASGSGGLLGINEHTTRADMLRATATGMTCNFARIFAPVRSSGDVDGVVLGGGASRGPQFRKLLAGLFAPLEVRCFAGEDVNGARGALYAFDTPASRAPVRKVRAPSARQRERIGRAYEQFEAACRSIARAADPVDAPFLAQYRGEDR